ncbi:MAG: bestrophin family ion channel [Myxococcota bacterium]
MLVDRRLPLRYIVSKIWLDLLLLALSGTLIEVAVVRGAGLLPEVDPSVAAFLGTSISLILSFKLAQSYQRWWEARKIWGAIVNDSRSLTRQVLTLVSADGRPEVERIAHRQIAWCYALGQSLRGLDWRVGSEGHLEAPDIAEAEAHANRPLVMLQQHARDITSLYHRGALTDFQRLSLDEMLTRLTDSMGKAERIKSTVFPTTYRLYLHLFIYVFLIALALSLAKTEGWKEVVVIFVIAIPFFLLERTATLLQDPFENRPTDCAVTAIARTIETNILQLLGAPSHALPAAPQDDDFYVL